MCFLNVKKNTDMMIKNVYLEGNIVTRTEPCHGAF